MSRLLEQTPRFSSGAALMRHYRSVKTRMSQLCPPPVMALPSPTMMARGNLAPVVETPKPEEKPIPAVIVYDPIPDQRHTETHLIRRLDPDLERLAIRRTVELFYERSRHHGGRRRALMLRNSTATAFRVSEASLLEPRRCIGITRIRQISMAIMGCLLDASLPEVGRAFAGRDHTTVLHAQRKMKLLVSEVFTEMYDGRSCLLPIAETPEQDEDGG